MMYPWSQVVENVVVGAHAGPSPTSGWSGIFRQRVLCVRGGVSCTRWSAADFNTDSHVILQTPTRLLSSPLNREMRATVKFYHLNSETVEPVSRVEFMADTEDISWCLSQQQVYVTSLVSLTVKFTHQNLFTSSVNNNKRVCNLAKCLCRATNKQKQVNKSRLQHRVGGG